MIDNLITDNLIINIASLSITVKEKSSLDKLAFWLYIQNIVMKHCFELRGDTMAKQIEGVYENVLRCARQEFLEKGFALASLRAPAPFIPALPTRRDCSGPWWSLLPES